MVGSKSLRWSESRQRQSDDFFSGLNVPDDPFEGPIEQQALRLFVYMSLWTFSEVDLKLFSFSLQAVGGGAVLVLMILSQEYATKLETLL